MTKDELLRLIDQAGAEGWTTLDLAGQNLEELPPEIGRLTQLQRLILGRKLSRFGNYAGNRLTSLPPEIGQLQQLKTLQLFANQLTVLPPEIGQLRELRLLFLEQNHIASLPPEIGQLQNLKTLLLGSNQLSNLPLEIGQLKRLRALYLGGNQFSRLPVAVIQLKRLQSLDLGGNQLNTLPPEIAQLQNLRSIYLGGIGLSNLPIEITQLKNLRSLYLGGNRLSSLPPEIVQLKNLCSLHVWGNRLSTAPPEIAQLKNLRLLNLRGNRLSNLPPEITQLKNLRWLNLRGNGLRSLPIEITQLQNLQSLDLSRNLLSSLPAVIARLQNLESLNLGGNQLSGFPAEVAQLQNLQSLDLWDTQLRHLPVEITQLQNLQSLDLSSNQLSSLPAEIIQLQNLQLLNLSFNQLSSLPIEITQLQSLLLLDINHNQLSNLPAEINQLKNLQSLDLRRNQLTVIPFAIFELANLTELNLSQNRINQIPPQIRQMPRLKQLDLRGNPVPIPPEILGSKQFYEDPGDLDAILDFYFQVQDPNETEPLYEAKLLIVGEGGAGKTSLAKKIEDQNYQLQTDEQSTKGIDILRWEFLHLDGKKFRVNIWDFGGQEIYHQTHQFFLTERSLYALVVDTRKENTDFYYWLNVVRLLSGDSPVLIVKNEKQDRQCQLNEPQLRQEFGNLKETLGTNLADNRGLPEIKVAIQMYISRLPHVGQPLPKVWVRVRSALENYAQYCDYISLEKYYEICKLNGFNDRTQMLNLSQYLHDLGVCLHFQKDPLLKRTVILRPEWGTTGVYRVLDTPKVKENVGCFTRQEAGEIWQDANYAEMHDELLQLMKNFKLCYEIPGRPNTFIAPQLLNVEQPQFEWSETDNLVLRYAYEFMPKGMITQFIVEMHRWIEQQRLVWRSGAVLSNGGSRAKIVENQGKREIEVRVSGSYKRDLMTVITHEFDKINDSYERLQYRKLIPCNCPTCKTSRNSHYYDFQKLRERLANRKQTIECGNPPYHDVNVSSLIDDFIDRRQQFEPDSVRERDQFAPSSAFRIDHVEKFVYQLEDQRDMSNINQYGLGDNIAGDKVMRDKIGTQINNSQNLAQAATDIKTLLNQLSQDYASPAMVGAKAIEEIDRNPTLKNRVLNALKEAGAEALEKAVDHPAVSIVVAGAKGFMDA